ncbi:lysophospholipid acyltransferase family protein [Aestuariivivens sediminicola]|uniref:lysophospholipid acyltransferase family protein n=1 Tax=Aestuariivivens sediminicola TaxID=2913560 RepID=UPI001F55B46F
MLYHVFKWLFYLTIRGYFRSIYIKGSDHIPGSGPVMFVANHNSAFMDPILLAVHLKRPLYFLARGESFKYRLTRWIFNRFHMIPIYRPEITPDKVYKNEAVFQSCFDHLKAQKSLMIFPEGVSKTERRLRKIKTGAARIALGAESQNGFQLNLKIIPIGINYSNPHYFRSHVFINIGAPIQVSDFEAVYHDNEKQAVLQLTDQIKKRLEDLVVIVKNERLDALTRQIELLYDSQLSDQKETDDKAVQKFLVSREIVKAVAYNLKTRPRETVAFEIKLNAYLKSLDRLKLRDKTIGSMKMRLRFWSDLLYFILGFPVFLFGYVFNIVPYKVSEILSRRIIVRKDFVGSMKIAFGMFVFLVFYCIETALFAVYIHTIYALVFLLMLYPTGLFTLNYIKSFYLYKEKIRYYQLNLNHNKLIEKLKRKRRELLYELEIGNTLYAQSLKEKL